jgi:hypothetical protein
MSFISEFTAQIDWQSSRSDEREGKGVGATGLRSFSHQVQTLATADIRTMAACDDEEVDRRVFEEGDAVGWE